ncbi:MAG: hypothetical protein HYX69_09355 [Planctomycetia bacterium]|nr:hypothetical protein [Planctomycetia bacterium]
MLGGALDEICATGSTGVASPNDGKHRRNHWHTLFALGVLLSLCGRAAAKTYDALAIGCTYNTRTAAAVEGNDRAISRFLRGLPDEGGVLRVDGVLHISQTIHFPERAYGDDKEPRPLNFGIEGNGATSRIVQLGKGWAVSVTSKFPTNYSDHHVRQFLRDVTVQGGGLVIVGSGKAFTTRGLVITGVDEPVALLCSQYDGGRLEFNCHDNAGVGAHFEDSHHVLLDATTRLNGGDGIQFVDCVVSGRVYSESNKGYGIDAVGLVRSNLTVWLEGNRGRTGNGQLQGRRRDCWGNLFTGMDQGEANVGWDDDTISREANRTRSNPIDLPPLGEPVTKNVTLVARGWPADEVTVRGDDIVIRPGAFNDHTPNRVISFEGGPELANLKYDAGDWFEFSADVTGDQDTLAWYSKRLESGSEAPPLAFSCNGLTLGQNFFLSPTGVSKLRVFAKAKQSGVGLKPYAYISAGNVSGPDRELKLSIRDFEVRYVKNKQ